MGKKTSQSHARIAQGNFVLPSPAEIDAAMAGNGGFSAKQLAEWGIEWPPQRGWRGDLERRWLAGHPDMAPKPGPRRIISHERRALWLLWVVMRRHMLDEFGLIDDETGCYGIVCRGLNGEPLGPGSDRAAR